MPLDELRIRPEAEDDRAFLKSLYVSTRDDLLQLGLPEALLDNLMSMQFDAQQMGYRQQYPAADFSIIERNDHPVPVPIGCMDVYRGTDAIRLINIALIAEARNRGCGRSLILALQAEAAAAGKPLTLSVSAHNLGAQRLYTTLQFGIRGNDGVYLEMVWPAGLSR